MASKLVATMLAFAYICATSAAEGIDKDVAECTNQLMSLATCLPYVGGESKRPTMDCCTGLNKVLDKSKKCLCVMIKDKDDPTVTGLNINASLAASLPSACHSSASVANISQCISMLHLAPNSPDAKIFQGLIANFSSSAPAVSVKGNSSSGSASAEEKSDGGRLSVEIIGGGILVWFFTLHLIISATI